MTVEALTPSRSRVASWLARRPDYVWEPPRSMAVTAVVIAVLAYVLVAWNARYPAIPLDEVVMVGNSRIIAGLPATWSLQDAGFMPGLAVLMAPAWWFTSDPQLVYQVGIAIASALGVAAIWPLSRIAKRTGLSDSASVVVASAVVVAPAKLLVANYLLSESLLLVFTAVTIVAAVRLAEHPTWTRAVLLGLSVGATVLAHGRGVAIAVGVGIWLLVRLRSLRWRGIVAGLLAFGASCLVYAFYVLVTAQVIADDSRVEDNLGAALGTTWDSVLAVVVGQTWYGTAGWLGTTTVGAFWILRRFRADALASVVAICFVAAFGLATFQLGPVEGVSRFDVWFYGRYNDHMWAILAVIGIAVLVRLRWAIVSVLALGVSLATSAGMVLITAPKITNGSRWVELHVLGVAPWLSLDAWAEDRAQSWLLITGITVALTAAVLAAALWRGAVAPVLLIGWTAISLWHDVLGLDIRDGRQLSHYSVPGVYSYLEDDDHVGIDRSLGSLGNMLYFTSDGQPLDLVDIDDVPEGMQVVYSWKWETAPAEQGARMLSTGETGTQAAWIYPGEVFDTLLAQGALASAEEAQGWAAAKGN
ncbi:hypothetical protein [Demequina sp. NBRC 110054]|uniref:hypothetical protein n=1 Tax=Demequina sp. NBRC 110054 TaxID=1570343 RepID=UPI000A068382|nr:hypothetical protein [Demequina sp. NBRC 110054]